MGIVESKLDLYTIQFLILQPYLLASIMFAMDMARGSSTWFCSTTWGKTLAGHQHPPYPALQVVEDKDLVVDIEFVVLDEASGGRVGPLNLPHVLP